MNIRFRLLFFFLVTFISLHAQIPELVKDINVTTAGSAQSAAIPFTEFNGASYFSPNSASLNIGLCKTNGTPAGTVVVKTIIQSIQSITATSNRLFFFSNGTSTSIGFWVSDGTESGTIQLKTLTSGVAVAVSNIKAMGSLLFFAHNNRLWRSDGTEAGTFELATFSSSAGLSSPQFTVLNGVLFFSGNTVANGNELWKTDGSIAGTAMVKDIRTGSAGSSPILYGVAGNNLLFMADNGVAGREIWKTDGTEANTVLVKDMNPGSASTTINASAIIGNTLFFAANTCIQSCSLGEELYRTDGTDEGTKLVKDINTGSANSTPRLLTNLNGTLYFSATDGSVGSLLWKTDGTGDGTIVVKNLFEGITGTGINSIAADTLNNRLILRASGGGTTYLWRSDGTNAGTQIIPILGNNDANPAPNNVTIAANRIFFTATAAGITGTELYVTNPDATSATLVKDIYTGSPSSSITTLATLGNKAVFFANSIQYGIEPWVSDGTEPGTVLLKDLKNNSNSASPANLLDVNGTLFFSAADGDVNNNELWKSDGTTAGTVLVKEIWPGLSGSNPGNFCTIDGVLYFTARNDLNNVELWRSDGTEGGTFMVKDIIPGSTSGSFPVRLTAMNGILYFFANHPTIGTELTRSDGTDAGTLLVKEILPGSSILLSTSPIFVAGNQLFFAFSDGTSGTELWKSDGTAEGTLLVKDIAPGNGSSNPGNFYLANGTLYFTANDGVNGNELWKTDGTAAGTVIVKDVFAGSGSGNPQQFVEFENNLVFWGPGGLWKSNGTDAGTLKMVDVTGTISNLTNVGGTLFFAGGPNATLMKSNLTQEGTKTILNSSPGLAVNSAVPLTNSSQLFAVGNTVYFRSANVLPGMTSSPGFEPWKCVNNADTGILLTDLLPGTGSSNPGGFTLSNGNLFFSATTAELGTELFKLFIGGGIPAATTWTGATSTAWEDAGNWTNGVPGATTEVTIPAGMPNYPTINTNTSVKSINLTSGTVVNLATGVVLTLLGK